jgi:hypothetical protein
VWHRNVLEPLPLRKPGLPKPPQGAGNVEQLTMSGSASSRTRLSNTSD